MMTSEEKARRIMEKQKAYEAAGWKPAGLCKCGKYPPLPGLKYCERCREKNISYNRQKRAELKEMAKEWRAAGLCSRCGKAVIPGHVVCEEHYQGYLDANKPKKEHMDTIDRINEEARAMGMSYGKYQLLKQLGKI